MSEVAAIVLAAGRGTRFGAAPKMLAAIDGEPLVRRAARAVLEGGLRPALVVTGHRGAEVAAALEGLPVRLVDNPAYGSGLSTSLQAGFDALPPESEAALVALGDMPGIGPALVRRLAEAWIEAGRPPALVPVHRGRRGNPVVLSRSLAGAISGLSGDRGAGPLLGSLDRVVELRVDDPGVLLDIDTPEALRSFPDPARPDGPEL
ncbi:MAG: nucleotidyltransferase family protein [Enterovirga sp.]|nr:nucleotidyltransferase family protein [Enterovirga sp.]